MPWNIDNWLTRWTAAGGGWASGSGFPHLLRPACRCDELAALHAEIEDPDRRQALAEHLKERTSA